MPRCRQNRLVDVDLVDTVGQALHVQDTLIGRSQSVAILIGWAGNLNLVFPQPGRVNHLQTQFAGISLWPNVEVTKKRTASGRKTR